MTACERQFENRAAEPLGSFHGDNTGSNPVGDANQFNSLR